MYTKYSTYSALEGIGDTGSSAINSVQFLGIWTIIAAILAIAGGIVLFCLFLRKAKSEKFNKFVAYLHDFLNFRTLWLDTIIRITYLILALFITLYSLGLLFTGSFIGFIMTLIIGNLSLRIVYELANLILILVRNTNDINKKLKEPKAETKK